jgi:uncharacterized protein (TIGR02996 family)
MLNTPQDTAFLRGILADPDDDAPRLIYADWLDEHGDADRAEFIRSQVRLARTDCVESEYRELAERAEDLKRTHQVEWVNQLPQFPEVNWEVFERGFISTVKFDSPGAFFASARHVFASAPIREIRLHQFYWPDATRLATSRHVHGIRVLDLNDGNRIGNQGVEALMRSPHLAGLHTLKLGRNSLGSAGARAVADSGHVRGLRILKMERNDMYDDGLRFLAASRALAGLETLDLDRTRTGDDGVKALARSKYLGGLRTLYLSYNLISDAGLTALACSEAATELQDLFLQGNAITDVGVAELSNSPMFARLERVFLRENKIGDAGAAALARSPYFEHLRELYLGGNRISGQAGDQLRARFGSRVNLH